MFALACSGFITLSNYSRMRKVYYIFNPKTRTYDRVYPNLAQRFLTILRRVLLFVIFGGLSFLMFYLLIETPSMKDVQAENSRLLAQYNILSQRLDNAMEVLQDMQQRDDNLYRALLAAEPVSEAARNAGYGGTNRYNELMDLDNSQLVVQTTQKMDMLAKQLYIQTKSFDEIVKISREQEQRLRSLPAIQPIANRDLKRTASGYGYRIDPIYNVRKFHQGMDFSCDVGKFLLSKKGTLDVNNFDYASLMGVEFPMNKEERVRTFASGSSHAMTLIAVDLDEEGNAKKWMVENSWGDKSGWRGNLIMTDEWFEEYMFRVVINKKYIPAETLKLLEQKPVMLPSWDPMFQYEE